MKIAGCKKRFSLWLVIALLLLSLFNSVGFVSADDVTVTFSGITNPSSTHKAYYFIHTTGTTWDGAGTEWSTENYSTARSSDNNRTVVGRGSGANPDFSFARFEFNVSKVLSDSGILIAEVTQLVISHEGYGYTANGPAYGIACAIKNDTASNWVTSNATGITANKWSHTTTGDDAMTITIAEANVSDVINASGILQFTTRGPEAYVTYVYTDYIYLTVTYTPSLTAPSLVSPTNGGTGYDLGINFDWNVSTGGTSPYTYEIMVADNLSFTSPDINSTGLSDSNFTSTNELLPATTYYWKVRTLDAGSAYSSWATTQSFTTASFTAPVISAPLNGVETSDTTPTITYSASTGGSGTYTYEVQIDDSSEFGSPAVDVTGQTSTSYTPTTELSLIRYYARVRAKDSLNNYSSWSSTTSFTVIASTSGGSGSASTMESTSTDPTINQSTIVEDAPTVTTSSGSTNIIIKYIITPVQTIVINPMKNFFVWVWESLTGLIRGINQEEIYLPVVGEITMSGLLILIGLGIAGWILLFGSPIKKKDVKKIGRTANKNVRKIKGMI